MPPQNRPGRPEVPPDIPPEYADAYLQAYADAYRHTAKITEVVQSVVEPEIRAQRERRRVFPRPRQAPVTAVHEPAPEDDDQTPVPMAAEVVAPEAAAAAAAVEEQVVAEEEAAPVERVTWSFEPPEGPGRYEFEPPEPAGARWSFEPPEADAATTTYEFEPLSFPVVDYEILDDSATAEVEAVDLPEDEVAHDDPEPVSEDHLFSGMHFEESPPSAFRTLFPADRPEWFVPLLVVLALGLTIAVGVVLLSLG